VDRNSKVSKVVSGMVSSLSSRRAWIEIGAIMRSHWTLGSLSSRRAWIEINIAPHLMEGYWVALLTESVDRNKIAQSIKYISKVALLTESVDRNIPD